MYRLLLVDDEAWVLKSIEKSVNWNQYGFEIVGTASDGKEALTCIETKHPDVVITDIKMPLMGGIQLIKEAKSRWTHMQFIIISGYAEFEHARKAMLLGTAGYCLKPVEDEDMGEILKVVKNRLDSQRLNATEVLQSIDETSDVLLATEIWGNAGLPWDRDTGMRVACGTLSGTTSLSYSGRIFLFYESELELIKQSIPLNESVGISRNIMSPQYLSTAVIEAQIAQRQFFMTGKQSIYTYVSASRKPLRQRIVELRIADEECNIKKVKQILDNIEVELKKGCFNIRHAYYCYLKISDVLDNQKNTDQDLELESNVELMEIFENVSVMISSFTDQFEKKFHYENGDVGVISNSVIRDILKHLEDNSYDAVTITSLAEQYHFNPNYLCRVFKREVGMPLTEYLIHTRLEKSCLMLRNTQILVNKIAEKCGYTDYFYFSRLFKRKYGITPSQYRIGMEGMRPVDK